MQTRVVLVTHTTHCWRGVAATRRVFFKMGAANKWIGKQLLSDPDFTYKTEWVDIANDDGHTKNEAGHAKREAKK